MTLSQRLFLALSLAGTLAAQTFIQMSDPQFGMYTKDADFAHETANFEFAIAAANRLMPAFVVITGDLINKAGDAAQAAEYKRIASKLNPKIKLFSVPGNHDVGNEPTAESLARYRERFGPDYYSFRVGRCGGPRAQFESGKGRGEGSGGSGQNGGLVPQRIGTRQTDRREAHHRVPAHFVLPERSRTKTDQYFNIPKPVRERYLRLLHEYGVQQVFAGHYHRNELGHDGDLEMVTSGPGRHAAGRREIGPPRGHREGRYGDAQVLRFRRTALNWHARRARNPTHEASLGNFCIFSGRAARCNRRNCRNRPGGSEQS